MGNKVYDVVRVDGIPIVAANFNWSVGAIMEKFIKSLAQKKILASKCPKCGYVTVPPRRRCPKCNAKMGDADLTDLTGKGTLLSHTAAHVQLDGKGNWVDLKQPTLIGAIKLDGADSTIFMPLGEVKEKDLKEGMKVEVKWRAETKGEIKDIEYFKA